MQITLDLMAAFVRCRYKAFLKYTGQAGVLTEYELLEKELAEDYREKAVSRLTEDLGPEEVVSKPPSITDALAGRHRLILRATSTDDHRGVEFPAIEWTATSARKRQYAPILFFPNGKFSRYEKSVAALLGTALSRWHGILVPSVKILHGPGFSATKLMLLSPDGPTHLGKVSATILHDLESLAASPAPPPMYLNDRCATCEYRDRCRNDAVDRDDLSLLRGLQPKEIEAWKKRGIFTVTQLAHTFRAKTMRRSSKEPKRHSQPLQAMAIRDQKIYVRKRPEMPTQPTRAFFDVEGVPEQGFYYLIGVVVVKDGAATCHQFWANDEAQEETVWHSFLDLLAGLGDYVLVHFGRYEKDFIREMQRRYPSGNEEEVEQLRSRLFDVHAAIRTNIFFPVYSNGLKDIAAFLAFQWRGPIQSGIDSIVWRYRWERTREDSLKEDLFRYNGEDCMAAMAIFSHLASLGHDLTDSVITVEKRNILPNERTDTFGKKEFAIPAMKNIVKFAYFTYQQEKVFFRTDRNVRKSIRRKHHVSKAIPKANRVVECGPPRSCPKCGIGFMKARTTLRPTKTVYDVKLFRGGVKRWVTKYSSKRYACDQCGHTCYSPEYPTKAPFFGHGLTSWVVYQHVAARQSFEALTDSSNDVFGYSFSTEVYHHAQSRLAHVYQTTEALLLTKLRSGSMIGGDEAKIGIRKGGDGYVWVFSGPEAVIYRFSKSRDATVLNEVLKGFNGVLVSDFYSVYDSVTCSQQKCLVHLTRGINDDLLKSPFDEELKELASRFTLLMTPIVEAIDRYGLTKLHLGKFKKVSDRFCRWVADQQFTSTIALGYQKRIGKYGDRLFTFLSYDGVPWNNNFAENAVKLIASRRKFLDGLMSEDGIKDYLIFLSIYQTLRRKGGSFLRFLLSRETDLFKFLGE